jgi:hypothetical protein
MSAVFTVLFLAMIAVVCLAVVKWGIVYLIGGFQ